MESTTEHAPLKAKECNDELAIIKLFLCLKISFTISSALCN